MVIEKPKLFLESRDFAWFMLVMLFVITIRLFYMHQSYQEFISKPFYYTDVKVLNAYQKSRNGRAYMVLKVKSNEGLTFFTSTSYRDKDKLLNRKIRLKIYPSERIGFFDYLGYFYVKSKIRNIGSNSTSSIKSRLLERVSGQHTDPDMSSFYSAIFFATALPKELREKISALGVSHLVALSGFHLGILWSLAYGILILLYRPFQSRYFPYRFSLLDIGLVTVLCLGAYLWLVDFPPSLVRSYAMVLVGWIVILMGMELLSFTFLATIGLTLLVLFPSLLVSLGFWLSVAGVFYIFLLLQYLKGANKWVVSLLVIPFGIFVLMLPVVHTLFGLTTPYQLLSPLLSILFIPFYPLVILMHLLGIGDMLDAALQWLFRLPQGSSEHIVPLWAAAVYLALSLGAVWSRWLFYLLLAGALGYAGYLYL